MITMTGLQTHNQKVPVLENSVVFLQADRVNKRSKYVSWEFSLSISILLLKDVNQ